MKIFAIPVYCTVSTILVQVFHSVGFGELSTSFKNSSNAFYNTTLLTFVTKDSFILCSSVHVQTPKNA